MLFYLYRIKQKNKFIFMKILNLLALSVLTYMAITLFSCGGTQSQDESSPEYQLSYSFGAQIALGLEQMKLTDEEKNVEKFVEGLKVGLGSDSTALAEAQKILSMRMQGPTGEGGVPSTSPEEAQNIAYSMGVSSIGGLAMEVEIPSADFNLTAVKEGYSAYVAKDSLKFSKVEMDSFLKRYFEPKNKEYQAVVNAKKEAAAAVAKELGEAFLATNATKEGITVTASGLQYEVIKEGSGAKPTLTDKVKTHYHGTLVDGTIFDSSVDRGTPATFGVNQVIPGWQEGIPLMSEGAKYRFYIPQDLAYGPRPTGKIPAFSALIFDVELIAINPAE
jgi:FKBP-type peptidyl-prolyl cis-trans isomerase